VKHETNVKSFTKCEINNVIQITQHLKRSEILDNNNSNYRCGSCDKDF